VVLVMWNTSNSLCGCSCIWRRWHVSSHVWKHIERTEQPHKWKWPSCFTGTYFVSMSILHVACSHMKHFWQCSLLALRNICICFGIVKAGKAKAGMVHSISGCTRVVQVKLWDHLRTCTIPYGLGGVITTNPHLPYLYLTCTQTWTDPQAFLSFHG